MEIDYKKLGSEIPKDSQHMEYIDTMAKALDAWKDENGNRAFMILACGENETIAPPKGLDPSRVEGTYCAAFAFGGNRRNMASLIVLLMRERQDFRNFLTLGINGFTTKECK